VAEVDRRLFLGACGAAFTTPAWAGWAESRGMPAEGPDTPHICLGPIPDSEINPADIRVYTQLGVSHVIMSGFGVPWKAEDLKAKVDTLAANGLIAGDIFLPALSGNDSKFMDDIVYGRQGRDEAIEEVKECIRAASAVGIPLIEYNFYAHRLSEGYFNEPDRSRGDAEVLSFDYNRAKDLPPLPSEGAHSSDELWANCEYFLKHVVPVAEKCNVRLALHPNDPPAPVSRGSQQIMVTLDDWKRLVRTVDSPSNCIILDTGVVREIGEDPVDVINWFGTRDRIGLVHYRNVRLSVPGQRYSEVFPDNGDNNMLAAMKALVAVKYKHMILPEHARGLDVDRKLVRTDLGLMPFTLPNYAADWAYNVAYARAMLQVALAER
jgi:mannonate dehydratase